MTPTAINLASPSMNVQERPRVSSRLYCTQEPPSLSTLHDLCSRTTSQGTFQHASSISSNVPIYDASKLDIGDPQDTSLLQDEWHHILLSGPGVFVIKHMYASSKLLEDTNTVFKDIIDSERGNLKGDHFSAKGKNDRVWNSFGKHGTADPSSFVEYYSNPLLALACEAWLGPSYRVTAQVNIIKPGGAAQISHRDYHLGFQTMEACEKFPKVMQVASQLLTLQGAVAHSDMPIESGPTRLMPYSQLFEEGYMAYRLPEFTDYFLENYVSLPLEMGDGIFFNPALFHAAGENTLPNFDRKANLLQVSSAFGKTMESVDSIGLSDRCWDVLASKYEDEGKSKAVEAFVAAVAEGYPFPTNLDRRPPGPGGLAPESEQEIVFRALEQRWSGEKLVNTLRQMKEGSCV
ncbi:MAG: hypothetical protein M1827_000489 [Pycnora praestabilis]|nr:MAG: hypothetical protein M1827_000489 [Pycnora praestabilis]